MTRERVQLAPAYVLRTQPYRDTSLLIEAWTAGHGRIGLVARGTRSARSRTRALLQPFQPLLLSWTTQGELASLSAAEAAAPAVSLAGEKIFSGWYLNELLLRLLPRHDPHPQLYRDYEAALAQLPEALEPALRAFEKRLLAELGYGLVLPAELDSRAWYRYEPESGPVPCASDDAGAFSGRWLIALRDDRLEDEASLRSARRLLRCALRALLGPGELQSARLLRQLRSPSPR